MKPFVVEQMAEDDAAVLRRNPVGADALEEGMGIRARHLELGEGRKVHEADALAHRERLLRAPAPTSWSAGRRSARPCRIVSYQRARSQPKICWNCAPSRLQPLMERGDAQVRARPRAARPACSSNTCGDSRRPRLPPCSPCVAQLPKRRGSNSRMLISAWPCTIHCARYLPAPPPWQMPIEAPQCIQ